MREFKAAGACAVLSIAMASAAFAASPGGVERVEAGSGSHPPPAQSAAASPLSDSGGDAVLEWNANAGAAAVAACISPEGPGPLEARMYAMMQLAVHDALNAIHRRYRPYALNVHVPGASPEAAVASAAKHTLIRGLKALSDPVPQSCIDAGVASVKADYADAMAAIPDGTAKAKGRALGQAAAAVMRALRYGDGSDTPILVPDYPEGTEPGEWRFAPGAPFAALPGWGDVTPFVMRSSHQFRPEPPYAVGSRRYARDVNQIKRLGGDDVTTPSARTAEQTEVALFWVESSVLMWNTIATTASTSRHLDMWQNARLFALLNAALADGYIGVLDTQYHYRFWRPITAIRLARADGNPRTHADPTWTSLRPTPASPDHASGHAVEGATAAWVLRRFFGTDNVPFTTCSETLPEGQRCSDSGAVTRHFQSFTEASDENGWSRVLLGFHFRRAADAGIEQGRKLGTYTVEHFLRPVR